MTDEVKVGQIWRDLDKRRDRQLLVTEFVSEVRGVRRGTFSCRWGDFVKLEVVGTKRITHIARARFATKEQAFMLEKDVRETS